MTLNKSSAFQQKLLSEMQHVDTTHPSIDPFYLVSITFKVLKIKNIRNVVYVTLGCLHVYVCVCDWGEGCCG